MAVVYDQNLRRPVVETRGKRLMRVMGRSQRTRLQKENEFYYRGDLKDTKGL